jgi:hypothetical protein
VFDNLLVLSRDDEDLGSSVLVEPGKARNTQASAGEMEKLIQFLKENRKPKETIEINIRRIVECQKVTHTFIPLKEIPEMYACTIRILKVMLMHDILDPEVISNVQRFVNAYKDFHAKFEGLGRNPADGQILKNIKQVIHSFFEQITEYIDSPELTKSEIPKILEDKIIIFEGLLFAIGQHCDLRWYVPIETFQEIHDKLKSNYGNTFAKDTLTLLGQPMSKKALDEKELATGTMIRQVPITMEARELV